jgi:hypothetical protein
VAPPVPVDPAPPLMPAPPVVPPLPPAPSSGDAHPIPRHAAATNIETSAQSLIFMGGLR